MKDKLLKLLLIVPVLAVLIAVPALTVLSGLPNSPLQPTAGYSVWENRSMAGLPTLTADSFLDGSYFSSWESFLSDRFYGRDRWLQLYTAYRMARRSASVSDVVLTDTVLLPQNLIPDYSHRNYEADAARMAGELRAICDQVTAYGGTLLYVGVPEQRSMFRDRYPDWQEDNAAHLEATEQSFAAAMQAEGVPLLLMRERLLGRADLTELYSTVDHHYTLRGAWETYLAVCEVLQDEGWDFPIVTEEHITFSTLPNPYLGTYNRKLYGLSPVTEPLQVYASDLAVPFTRTDNGEAVAAEVLQLPAGGWQYVYYTNYMGGDKAETVIDTGRDELPSILIWGDSFTNAFETIAWMSFDEMRAIDLRYYDEMTLAEYIETYQPDIVLCIRDDLNYLTFTGNGTLR